MRIPNRPKITDAELDVVVARYFPNEIPEILVVGVRGYFLNTVGRPGINDVGIYDDAMLVHVDGQLLKTFNANTDPSKANAGKAMLEPGIYTFVKGLHKSRIRAFRAYPEGVELPCKRQNFDGTWEKSTARYINIHDGGPTNTWSDGCQTVPNFSEQRQFDQFRDLVYSVMLRKGTGRMTYLLVEEPRMRAILDGKE